MKIQGVLLAGLAFCFGVHSLQQEETADRVTISTCAGANVSFPWRFNSTSKETIPQEMKWILEGNDSTITVAIYHNHMIVTGNQSYKQRLQLTEDGSSMTLTEVTPQDSGKYSLQVTVPNGHVSVTAIVYSLLLKVVGLVSSDGDLHVEMGSSALWDKDSSQWMIGISCGPFSFSGQPPFDVTWMTPRGDKLDSSNYAQGYFHLHLFSPVLGGRYTCHVPPQHFATACVSPWGGSQGDRKLEDSVRVDGLKARLLMLEADLKIVKDENQDLKETQTHLQERSKELEEKFTQQEEKSRQLEEKSTHLEEKSTQLEEKFTQLAEKSKQLEEKSKQQEEKSRRLEEKSMHLGEKSERLEQKSTQLEVKSKMLEEKSTQQEVKSRQLEEKSRRLEEKFAQLRQDVTELRQTDHLMREEVSRNFSGPLAQLKQSINHMGTNVAFMTKYDREDYMGHNQRIKPRTVLYNQGNAYQAGRGEFTAPLSGTFFFFLKTESQRKRLVRLEMKKEGRRILYLYAYDRKTYQTSSGGVVVHLNRGQRVWVDTTGNSNLVRGWTTFGGFLVHPDINN